MQKGIEFTILHSQYCKLSASYISTHVAPYLAPLGKLIHCPLVIRPIQCVHVLPLQLFKATVFWTATDSTEKICSYASVAVSLFCGKNSLWWDLYIQHCDCALDTHNCFQIRICSSYAKEMPSCFDINLVATSLWERMLCLWRDYYCCYWLMLAAGLFGCRY
jgi:hypothetical protein